MRRGAIAAALALLPATIAAAPPIGGAEQATRVALARIAARDPAIHAVIALNPHAIDQARALDRQRSVRGPLYGQVVLVKDNIETADGPTTAGSLALAANDTKRDAPLVARLRAAGAVILGKTNLSEWANARSAHSMSGWSAVGGQTGNAHDPRRTPCGSSSGSGAAVAAGEVTLAIGTETDGSVTCPSSMNGIVGLKPTVGLVSRTHIVPISHSQDTAGPMAADVRGAAMLLSVIAGSDPADPATAAADAHRTDYLAALDAHALAGARIGVLRYDTGSQPKTDAVFEAALAVLRRAGATLVDIKASGVPDSIGHDEGLVLDTELKADLATYLATAAPAVTTRTLADLIAFDDAHATTEMPLFGQDGFIRANGTTGLDDPAYRAARQRSLAQAGAGGIDRMLADNKVTALIGPTVGPAWFTDPIRGDGFGGEPNTGSFAAIAGLPHLTVPMGRVQGMPVGLSFYGPAWSEARLLSLGYAYERARGVIR